MAQLFPIRQDAITFDDSMITFYVSGSPTSADVGKAVTLDTTAATTVKLTTAASNVVGVLEALEVRTQEGITVGTISRRFCKWLAWDPADIVNAAVGVTVVGGATAGTVKAGTQNWSVNMVVATKVENGTTYGLVQKIA